MITYKVTDGLSKLLYLLQHAHNTVNWFLWTEEAFEISKSDNKPAFLSIGYIYFLILTFLSLLKLLPMVV
ncbi:hypothetical protein FHR92_003057 [Fontibacillus solani]|uniref:Spermatogenesis-associated protein 20-like TRX domain-containing protein n=1 Tax=Fontibacillus solani TaxID=1572857 RepID=A0A7W3SUQ8_9BACL|nr:hypothetical protein [Fontibacillus solani]